MPATGGAFMRPVSKLWIVLMVCALSWCLGLAQATSADPSQAQDQPEKAESKKSNSNKQSQDQQATSSETTTTSSAQTVPAGSTTVTATIKTAGSPYKSRIKWLQPSLQGTSGLFDVFSAEGFRKGEFSLQFGGSNHDCSPA